MHDANLRAAVKRTEQAVAGVPQTDASSAALAELRAAWSALVEVLALGPAPEVRDCPACGRTVMRAATLCGHCWTKLSPADVAPTPQAQR